MPTGAIIALAGAIAGFVGIGIFVAVRGRKIRWPKGRQGDAQIGIYKCRAIVSEGSPRIDLPKLARVGAEVSRAIVEVWEQVKPESVQEVRECLKHTGIYLLSDSEYDALDGKDQFMDSTNGTVTYAGRMIGSGISLATARIRFLPRVLKDGGVVAHELLHVANRAAGASGNVWTDVRHEDPLVWQGAGGPESIEARVKALLAERLA